MKLRKGGTILISPFSIQHQWKIDWSFIPSNEYEDVRSNKKTFVTGDTRDVSLNNETIIVKSKKEKKALNLISNIGVIDGKQLYHLFAFKKKQLKAMVREKKLVEHLMYRNDSNVKRKIYTLGQIGSYVTNEEDIYRPNYWMNYSMKQVLERLIFFKLYEFFPHSYVEPPIKPFCGLLDLMNDGNFLNVYVVRGDTKDIINFFKWNENNSNKRILLITESMNHIKPILPHIKNANIIITTDQDLLKADSFKKLFYKLEDDGNIQKHAM